MVTINEDRENLVDAQGIVWGWKNIAKFLGVNERSIRRWVKLKDNPLRIYKDGPGVNARIFAYAEGLRAWREGRRVKVAP